MNIEEAVKAVKEPDGAAAREAAWRWDRVAKPLNSLGELERDVIRIAGAQGSSTISIGRKAIVVMCADNGIVEEGVTQTGQAVTAIVAENMAAGSPLAQSCQRNPQFPKRGCYEQRGSSSGHRDRYCHSL